MTLHAKIQKWGNGLALRISGAMREIPHLKKELKWISKSQKQDLQLPNPKREKIFPSRNQIC
jgi:antitoxin MazE